MFLVPESINSPESIWFCSVPPGKLQDKCLITGNISWKVNIYPVSKKKKNSCLQDFRLLPRCSWGTGWQLVTTCQPMPHNIPEEWRPHITAYMIPADSLVWSQRFILNHVNPVQTFTHYFSHFSFKNVHPFPTQIFHHSFPANHICISYYSYACE